MARRDPQAVALVLAADHLVTEPAAFVEACASGGRRAQGLIMTLGITPDSPATGYGYIRPGQPVEGGQGATQVERFVEKPDAATAARYVAEGYLWNSGNFLFQAGVMREELEAFAPEVLAAAAAALDGAVRDLDFIRLAPEAFQKAPKISIDYAVMEKTKRAGVLPVSCGWSDVGSWGTVWEVSEQDAHGNVVRGRATLVDTRNSLVHSDGLIAAWSGSTTSSSSPPATPCWSPAGTRPAT